jgi:hypothetical protein
MKASDFSNSGQQPQYKERRPSSFTGDHLVKIIKSIAGVVIIYLFIEFGKWTLDFIGKNPKLFESTQSQSQDTLKIKSDTLKLNILKNESKRF